jgi:hypothetical protein
MSTFGRSALVPIGSAPIVVEVGEIAGHRRAWRVVTGEPTVHAASAVAWGILVLLLVSWFVRAVVYDVRTDFVGTDEPTFIFQAQSLAGSGHDLSFDADDLRRWRSLGGPHNPPGLFFQRYGSGWAFAKPYGYSLYAAPFVAAFGAVRGVAVGNALLLVALVAICGAMLRLRYRGPVVPWLLIAFCLLAQPVLYAFLSMADLFLCVGTAAVFLLVLLHARTGSVATAAGAFAAMAFLVTERPTFLALFAPLAVVMLISLPRWRQRVIVIGVGLGTWLVAAAPYLYYSDGRAWNAYAGERFAAVSSLPFDLHIARGRVPLVSLNRGQYFSPGAVAHALTDHPLASARSSLDFFVGRDAGLLVFLPAAVLLLVAAVLRWRTFDRWAWSVGAGIALFIVLHVVIFPHSYPGGFYAGNRYFLQIAPCVLAFAIAARISTRSLAVCAAGGSILAVAFLGPQLVDPRSAIRTPGKDVEASWLRCRLPKEPQLRVPGNDVVSDSGGVPAYLTRDGCS